MATYREPLDEFEFDGMRSGKTTKVEPKAKPKRMLHDYALVRAEAVKVGNIIIPDGAAEKSCLGEVVAIGPGTHVNGIFVKTEVKAGDRVRFGKWAHNENVVKVDIGKGLEELLMMRENDILWIEQG